MSNLTQGLEGLDDIQTTTNDEPGLFARFLQMRERSARAKVQAYLAAQSDERLADLGFSESDIAALRAGELRLPSRT